MESSIPSNLRCPRSQVRRVRDDYAPPYPAWVARAPAHVRQVTMAYLGVQWRGVELAGTARSEFAHIASQLGSIHGPVHFDRAHEIDGAGFENLVVIAYWIDTASFERWQAAPDVAAWWQSREQVSASVGYFREIISPHLERFETLFSTANRMEGIGVALGERSAEDVCEHAYWGSMRDRIPLSQTDPLDPAGSVNTQPLSPSGRRIRVVGHENLAIIRSGQEWTETQGKERSLYTGEIEPTLRTGMQFLRDHGGTVGCYFNRYMRHVDADGRTLEKTFGLSLWRSLAHLEHWAEAHPTHLAIFGTFMKVVQALEFNLQLRLYHEVAVLAGNEQLYEYINCHPGTGMLTAPH